MADRKRFIVSIISLHMNMSDSQNQIITLGMCRELLVNIKSY